MNRQQRTNYKRQRMPVGTLVPQQGMTWTPQSAVGNFMVLQIWEDPQGLVLDGVPPIVSGTTGRTAIGATLLAPVPFTPYALLQIEWDTIPDPGEWLILASPWNGLRNRYGGQMNAARMKWPSGTAYDFNIVPAPAIHSPTELEVNFYSAFGPVCLGDGFQVQNTTTIQWGSFTGWFGPLAIFNFPAGVHAGDVIDIPAGQVMLTTPYGGVPDSFNGPV